MCTQYQCHFKEEGAFRLLQSDRFTPEIVYMLVYAVHCKCTQTKGSSSKGHIWFGKLLNKTHLHFIQRSYTIISFVQSLFLNFEIIPTQHQGVTGILKSSSIQAVDNISKSCVS